MAQARDDTRWTTVVAVEVLRNSQLLGVQAHTHTHTCTYVHAHTCMHTCTRTHTNMHVHARTHVHAHMQTCTHTHAHALSYYGNFQGKVE